MSQIIYGVVTNPAATKGQRSKRAVCQILRCHRTEDCVMYARGECASRGFTAHCPHGRWTTQRGPTPRARAYGEWRRERLKALEDAGNPSVGRPSARVAVVGDYVYLPYPHLCIGAKGKRYPIAFGNDRRFLPVVDLTPEWLAAKAEMHPQALIGGEIKTYQRDSLPRMVAHFLEEMPALVEKAAALSPRLREVIANLTPVGRKALLRTVVPNVGTLKGWRWDGTYLRGRKAEVGSTPGLGSPIWGHIEEVLLRPSEGAEVVIEDEGQAGPDTVLGE